MLMRALLPLRMRPRVQRAPGIPCALWFMEGQAYGKNSGDLRRENAESHPTVVIPGRASFLARARNPSHRDPCGPMDSGLAPLRIASRNDEERGSRCARPGMTRERLAPRGRRAGTRLRKPCSPQWSRYMGLIQTFDPNLERARA